MLMLTKHKMDIQIYNGISKCQELSEKRHEEIHREPQIQNKPDRGRKRKTSKTFGRKLVRDVFNYPRTCRGMDCEAAHQEKVHFCR